MRMLKSKKGSALITVLAVASVGVLLAVSFATLAFWSYSSTHFRVERDRNRMAAKSVAEAFAGEIVGGGESILDSLDRINPGSEWKNVLNGTFDSEGLGRGSVKLFYVSAEKKTLMLEAAFGKDGYRISLRRKVTSYAEDQVSKIYDNTFYFPVTSYFTESMPTEGNIYMNGSSGLQVLTADQVHNGNVLCKGDLEINSGSVIYGDVIVSGNLSLTSHITVKGNLNVGGDLMIASDSVITGDVLCGGKVSCYDGKIYGSVSVCGDLDLYQNSLITAKTVIGGRCFYLGSEVTVYSEVKELLPGGMPEFRQVTFQSKLPDEAHMIEWKKPASFSEQVVPADNTVRKSGVIQSLNISPNSDLIFDTTAGDLYLSLDDAFFVFQRDIVIRGEGRVFLFLRGEFHFGGHIGRREGQQGVDAPSKCKLFLVEDTRASVVISDGGRFDGYAYLPNGTFTAKGRGRATGGEAYKIVGCVAANTIEIDTNEGASKIIFVAPDLSDIDFGGSGGETGKIETWEISGYDA